MYERLRGLLLSSLVRIESLIGAFFLPFGMARRPGAEPFLPAPPRRRRSRHELWIAVLKGLPQLFSARCAPCFCSALPLRHIALMAYFFYLNLV